MKKASNVLLLSAIMMFLCGSVYAYDNEYHVIQAPNGKGDMLIFPAYFATPGGWETKFSVVNTSEVYSVVAKVVFRSNYNAQELQSVMIYLSPTDVWTASVKNNGLLTIVYSDDDSVLVSDNEFAGKSNPVSKTLSVPQCPNDSANFGYIEVIETWYGDVSRCYPPPANAAWKRKTPGVSNDYLKQLYPPDSSPKQVPGLTGEACEVNSHRIDHTVNVLSGYMEIQNPTFPGMTSAMRAAVFADFDITDYLNSSEESGLHRYQGRNTLGELEAAMSKNSIAMPYVNNYSDIFTFHIINFPTKLSRWSYDETRKTCSHENGTGPFWVDSSVPPAAGAVLDPQYVCQEYYSAVFDNKRNVSKSSECYGCPSPKMCWIVNLLPCNVYSSLFTEGWTLYQFYYGGKSGSDTDPTHFSVARYPSDFSRFSYSGIPAIPAVFRLKLGGISMMEGSYDDGKFMPLQQRYSIISTGIIFRFPA